MWSYASFLCIAVYLIVAVLSQNAPYWREYKGHTPYDAFRAGTDMYGDAIYIGQTLHPSFFLMPGTIKPKEKKIFYEFSGSEHSTNQDVLILCTLRPDTLKWIDVAYEYPVLNVTHNDLPAPYQLIDAGSDQNRPIVVGRFKSITATIVGKILIVDNIFQAIYGGNGLIRYHYQALLYDANDYFNQVNSNRSLTSITINIYN